MTKKIFVFSLILIFAINISYLNLVWDVKYIGWLINVTYLMGIPLLLSSTYKKGNKVERLYIGVMFFGMILHAILPEKEKYPVTDALQWIFLAVIVIASRKYYTPRFMFYILIAFFISHCVLAVIEYKMQMNLFDYSYVAKFNEFSAKMDFRAFGLMEHPLYSANVTLIIMSFIMISKDINWVLKILLLLLGSLAMISFNSRTATIILGCLLIYRYVLYNLKPIYIIVLGTLVYTLFLNDFTYFIQQNSNIFGRLAEKNNLTDDSSLTRLMSYFFFWNERWSFQDIVFGGRTIYMPGTEVSIENGILLTIAWWGWIVGVLKVILELIISYLCLKKYNIKDKLIVMIACWVTAFANNNSINTFVFAFFIVSFLSINSLANNKYNKVKKLSPILEK
ncbi:hypothetical protein ACM55F_11145 [Flavobacterium sp. XS2P12]|uniref:hypothetical protein n=1 Tax=Flavobacterium melibiosi TaxID=3398734 RepID=UPI003A85DFF9